MNNRKLVSILAITGVVANLGLATVFAQTTGSEVVGCNTAGAISIGSASAAVTFEARTTDFSGGDAGITGTPLDVVVTDSRGYNPSSTATCGAGSTLTIQSAGLNGLAVGNTTTNLSLGLGTALTSGSLSCTSTTCSPATLSDVATVTGATTGNISAGQSLVTFTEAFYGDIQTHMTGNDLEVTAPSAPVPADTYEGQITFTLV